MKNLLLKITDRISIILLSIFLVCLTLGAIIIPLTASKGYYEYQFKKNNTVEQLKWNYRENGKYYTIEYTEENLGEIIEAIIEYLMDDRDSMQVEVDGKTVFSNQALIHMKDVKVLYQTSILLLNIVFFLTIGILVYIYFRFKYIKPIMFKYSLLTFGIILSICAIMGIWILLDWEKAFEFFHKVIFPDPIKFRDAFFGWKSYYEELPHINNVVLVTVLSTSTFMDAAIIIISGTLVTYILYLVLTILIKKEIIFKSKEKQPN